MRATGLLFQFFAIGFAVAIAVLFVQPRLAAVEATQNEIQQFADARTQVAATNATLNNLVSTVESVSLADRRRLNTYLPTVFDEVAVMRDIENIVTTSGVVYTEISYDGKVVDNSDQARLGLTEQTLVTHGFTIQVTGAYNRIKDFLSLLEQHQYPLHAHSLSISVLDGGFLQAGLQVYTYTNEPLTAMSN